MSQIGHVRRLAPEVQLVLRYRQLSSTTVWYSNGALGRLDCLVTGVFKDVPALRVRKYRSGHARTTRDARTSSYRIARLQAVSP